MRSVSFQRRLLEGGETRDLVARVGVLVSPEGPYPLLSQVRAVDTRTVDSDSSIRTVDFVAVA